MNLGKRLKERRLELSLTQSEVAEKAGIKRAAYSLYESNKREPGIEILRSIAKALDTNLSALLENGQAIKEICEDGSVDILRKNNDKLLRTISFKAEMSSKPSLEPTYEDIESLIAQNGKRLSIEEKQKIIKLLLSDD